MMWFFQEPSADRVARFVAEQSFCQVTYPEVGATAAEPPPGYVVDRNRIELGRGSELFAAAIIALGTWEHFRLGWVEACPGEQIVRPGTVVAVKACVFGLWTLNA